MTLVFSWYYLSRPTYDSGNGRRPAYRFYVIIITTAAWLADTSSPPGRSTVSAYKTAHELYYTLLYSTLPYPTLPYQTRLDCTILYCIVASTPSPSTHIIPPRRHASTFPGIMRVAVKTMVPFWVLSILRQLVFRGPKRGPEF